jgi:hypothetical protein
MKAHESISVKENTMQIDDLFDLQRMPTLSAPSDTSVPLAEVPIFFIHTMDRPFCQRLTCECHQNQSEVKRLLLFIEEGLLTLREASEFQDGRII